MAVTVTLKRNDTLPNLDVRLKDTSSSYLDLSLSGISINFSMREIDTNVLKINSAQCEIVVPSTGAIRYVWNPTDTDTAGFYLGEFEVNYPTGEKETYPSDQGLVIYIIEDLNEA